VTTKVGAFRSEQANAALSVGEDVATALSVVTVGIVARVPGSAFFELEARRWRRNGIRLQRHATHRKVPVRGLEGVVVPRTRSVDGNVSLVVTSIRERLLELDSARSPGCDGR